MGLTVTIFVPEGVVVVSDGLAEIRNAKSDDGFLQKRQKSIFSFEERFLVCAQCTGYIEGLPIAYHINKVFNSLANDAFAFATTKDFCYSFKEKIFTFIPTKEQAVFYIAGIDMYKDCDTHPVVYLLDRNSIQIINQSNNNEFVYNYHSFGRNLWINKLLLPTVFEYGKNEKIVFDPLDIDFSKYSLNDAIEFGKTLLEISCKMDNFTQLKQMVGENISIGYIAVNKEIKVIDLYTDFY